MVSDLLFGLGIGALFAFVGLTEVYRGLARYREEASVTGTEARPVADIEPGETVAVQGTVRAVGDRRAGGPLFGESGVVVGTEVAIPPSSADDTAEEVHQGVRSRPFVVEDDTGSVRVEVPEAATVEPAEKTTERYDFKLDRVPEAHVARFGSPPPEAVERYHRAVEELEDPESIGSGFSGSSDRRYREGSIDPGDEVYVQGRAVDRDGEWGERTLTVAGGDDPGSVSVIEGGPDEYRSWLESAGLYGRIVLGVLFAVAGIGTTAVVLITGG